ncbi:hypothetical protein HX779_25920 [Pseudomonas sp. A4002]|uniref:hypothetical protein n=1 Tax=unclassified Pseudomonas TaxID=196821 RepID=UPI0015A03A89|nr:MULTISPECIES: hypothetical protein [unclassified Pseudomonas]NVZ35435.1 hypothetical protein [Pseudomonas sp. A4002]NWB80971.1 hypothetical protein [Pseudomonas sp. F9001]
MPAKSATAIVPEVTLVQAVGRRLDPLDAIDGATLRVCYEGMSEDDLIRVFWKSLPGEEYAPEPLHGVTEGCVDFHIPPYYVGLRINRFALFRCVVTHNGEEFSSSESDIYVTLPFNDLPHPDVPQAVDGVLDLTVLCGQDPQVYVTPWVFIDPIQFVWLDLHGTLADGSAFTLRLVNHEQVTEAEVHEGWRRALPLDKLRGLKQGSQLTLVFIVAFNGPEDDASRLFPSTTLTVLTEPHLNLVAPTLVEATLISPEHYALNPVNAQEGATIRVSYEQMCPCDWVCAYWEGTPGAGSPQLECKNAGDEAFVEFHVPPSAISANFNEQVTVHYTVQREGQTWPSPERHVQILNVSELPAPQVLQATGHVLDLNTFHGDAQALVIPFPYRALGQPCWLWATGELDDGTPYHFDVLEGEPLAEEWLHDGVSAVLSRHELQKLADCSGLSVHFAVNFNGQVDLASAERFPVLHLELEQEALVLDAPRGLEAVGQDLTIWNGRDGVTVRVEYAHISSGQMISLDWIRSDGTRLPLAPEPGNGDPGYVDFPIPREAVIQGAGKTIQINYTVTSACKRAPSKTLNLRISVPVRLPVPVVPEATPPATQSGILDLRTFAGDAHITVEKWWFILAGQRGWLQVDGTREDGSAYVIRVMMAELITEGDVENGLRRVLLRSELEQLRNLTPLVVTFGCTPDGSPSPGQEIVFPVLSLVFTKPMKDVTDFNPNQKGWNNWQRGAGAASQGDLVLKTGAVPGAASGYYLFDWGNTYTSNPVTQREKLFKLYTQLQSGRIYRFSAWIRDNSGSPPKPSMVLVANGADITSITSPGLSWQLLQGTFTATSTTRLSVDNRQMGNPGNDFDVTLLVVEEV